MNLKKMYHILKKELRSTLLDKVEKVIFPVSTTLKTGTRKNYNRKLD